MAETKPITVKDVPVKLWKDFRMTVMDKEKSVPEAVQEAIEMWLKKNQKKETK